MLTTTKGRRRAFAAFGAAIVLGLATAGSAAAIPPNPIALNTVNWTAATFGSGSPAWYQDGFGLVHLQGAVKQFSISGPNPNLIGKLPPAARPTRNVFTIVHTFLGTYANLEVLTDGSLEVIGPHAPAVRDLSFVSLEGITYERSGVGALVPLNVPSWLPAGGGTTPPGYVLDPTGIVHLQGAARQTCCSTLLGTLPPAARPIANVFTIVPTRLGTYADLAVLTNGSIIAIAPKPPAVTDLGFLSLESVSFRATRTVPFGPVFMNTTNWGPGAFGTMSPQWYKDAFGIVHLVGAASQAFAGPPDPSLIGTLPGIARPTRTVYTIVHTHLGTYADLAILPNGQIREIDPRPPAVRDLSFLSLETISYQQ